MVYVHTFREIAIQDDICYTLDEYSHIFLLYISMTEKPERQPEAAAPKSNESMEKQNQVDFATLMFAVRIEAMGRLATTAKNVMDIVSKELPKFNLQDANAHSIEELQQFLKQSENPIAVATVVHAIIEHPNSSRALDGVKPLLDNNDLRVYSAALAYMMAHGSPDDLPVHIKDANDLLAATIQSEKKLLADYDKSVAESIERAKKTGRGGKAHLLFDRPHESPDLFLQYTSLAQGYGAALRRGQDTLPQLKKLIETSNNDTALVMTGSQLVESDKFNEIKEMLVTSKEKAEKDALLLSMFMSIHMSPNKDKTRQTERVRQISNLSKELLAGDTPFDAVQEEFLKKLSGEEKQQ